MFEGLRKHSSSFFLVILVATVAMVFGVQWGPSSQGCNEVKLNVPFIAKVHNRTLHDAEYVSYSRLVRNLVPQYLEDNPAVAGAVRQGVLDGLIERELLAHEAENLGFHVTDAQVNDEFKQCRFFVSVGSGAESTLSVRSGLVPFPPSFCGGVGNEFDYTKFERFARRYFGRTVTDLREMMAREMLASRMREIVRSSVQVSDEEMWREYQRTHDQMAVKYIRFNLGFYRNLVHDDDQAQVDAWAAQHAEDINRQYERRRDSLRGLHREIRVRHILVKFASEPATDAQKAETRARAEAIRARIAAGEDFIRLARLYSDDPGSWRTGGELGWRQPDGDQGYVPEFTRAANALQVGGISPVTETSFGYHIIQLLGVREGDVPEAEAKRDLARTLFRDAKAAELVEAAARGALTRIAGGAEIDTVARELRAAALRDFFRGEVPATVTLAGGVTLAPVERSDLDPPELKESEQFARNGAVVNDVENGQVLVSTAFNLTAEHPLVSEPIHVGEDWFVLRFKDGSRTVATREEFARQRQELLNTTYASMLAARQRDALVQYVSRLRSEAEREGKVRIGNSPRLRAQQNEGEDDN
jgi:parvulin-like peptidyl-prolyl isomerase